MPLALSKIIDAIKLHKHAISFSVPLEHIERLYGWANIYMHSGFKQYTWSPIYALAYLRPFLVGGQHLTGMSVDAGITAPYGVVKQVQSVVESRIGKTRYSLVVDDPSHCDLIVKKP